MARASLIPAVAYVRMSSRKQDKSPEQQRAEIIRHARNRDYKILRWYSDEGRSGGKETKKRTGFLQIIDDAERLGDFRAVLTWNKLRFDRLDPLEGAEYKLRPRACGVILDTVADGVFDWATEEGQLLDTFHSMKGNKDLIQLSREVIRGKLDAVRERGRPQGGQPPYGLARVVTDDKGRKHSVPRRERFRSLPDWDVDYVAGDAEELKRLRWMFKTLDERDVSPYWLARKLNDHGVPSPHGGQWRDMEVRRLLMNRTYVGDYVVGKKRAKETFHRMTNDGAKRNNGPRGRSAKTSVGLVEEQVVKEGRWAPVIDPALFLRVQAKLAANKASGRKPRAFDAGHPLSGILHCGHCGARLLANPKQLKRGLVVQYNCGTFKLKPGQCIGAQVDQSEVIHKALHTLQNCLSPDRIADFGVRPDEGRSDRASTLKQQIESVGNQIERGNRRVCEIADERTAKGVLAQLDNLYSEKDRLEAELRELVQPTDVPRLVKEWADRHEETLTLYLVPTGEKKKHLCSDGVERVLQVCEAIEPLALRQAFQEIGLRLDCHWVEREKRTRAGKYRLDRVELSVDLGKLNTQHPSGRIRSALR